MKSKVLVFLALALASSFIPGLLSASHSLHHASQAQTEHWSVIPRTSVYDSLKVEVKKAVSPGNTDALKEYIDALQFRELLSASDKPLPPYPISAGIYNGSISTDSLTADDQLLLLYRNLGDRKGEAGILSSLGTKAGVNGEMDKALMFFYDALKINTEFDDKAGMIKNYLSLARIYQYQNDLAEAVRLNEIIVNQALEIRNNRYLGEAYLNLASIWNSQKKHKAAEALMLNKALPLFCYKLQDKVGAMRCYDLMAEIFESQGRYSEAKWFCIQSNMLARKIKHTSGIVNSLVSLAHVKMSIGDHQLALSDFREAEQLSISNKYQYKLVEIKNDLSKVHAAMGNTSAATSALTEFTVLKEAILKNAQ
jgi:tetratricopeptide (TPR) repeat protein